MLLFNSIKQLISNPMEQVIQLNKTTFNRKQTKTLDRTFRYKNCSKWFPTASMHLRVCVPVLY